MEGNRMNKKFAVKKRKLFEEVIDQFQTLLESGEYQVGDKLPSLTNLAELFNVGKPTLREALSVLTSTGVLEINQGSGVFVRRLTLEPEPELLSSFEKVDSEQLLYWLEFRRAFEVEAAGLAALRRSEDDLRELEEIERQLEAELEQGKIASEWDYKFHYAIAKATKNPIFTEAISSNAHILQQQFFENIRQTIAIPSRRELIITEHQKLIEAIKNGKTREARQMMRKHIENAERKMKLLGATKN
jgi:GntR family transcriptional regulator, transcriptional repressor for pyruvate dehydrogenase complex